MNQTQQNYYNNLVELVNNKGGKVISDRYINNATNITIECRKEHQWQAAPNKIKLGKWCPKCCNRYPAQAKKDFYKLVQERGGKVLSKYINTQNKILLECSKGHQWKVIPSNIKSGTWCAKCAHNCPVQSEEIFHKIVKEQGGKVLGTYINTRTKVLIECSKGHQWEVIAARINQGCWCPTCNESHLERGTRLYLEKNNIPYEREYTLPELSRKRYDFYLPDHNIFIELDGAQHFQETPFFHRSSDEFTSDQNSDRLKTLLIMSLGHRLIRIDYTQKENIDGHLDKALQSQGYHEQLYLSSPDLYKYLDQNLPDDYINDKCPYLTLVLV